MRILMLGNSYIFTNDLPSMLAEITGAEVIQNTRGGARLREQLYPWRGTIGRAVKSENKDGKAYTGSFAK